MLHLLIIATACWIIITSTSILGIVMSIRILTFNRIRVVLIIGFILCVVVDGLHVGFMMETINGQTNQNYMLVLIIIRFLMNVVLIVLLSLIYYMTIQSMGSTLGQNRFLKIMVILTLFVGFGVMTSGIVFMMNFISNYTLLVFYLLCVLEIALIVIEIYYLYKLLTHISFIMEYRRNARIVILRKSRLYCLFLFILSIVYIAIKVVYKDRLLLEEHIRLFAYQIHFIAILDIYRILLKSIRKTNGQPTQYLLMSYGHSDSL